MKYTIRQEELQQQRTATQIVPQQQSIDQRVELSLQPGNELVALFYSLSNSFSVIQSAFYMLKIKKISQLEQEQYLEALNRNLANAERMLGSLNDLLQLETDKDITLSKPTNVAELLISLKSQLPKTAPQEFDDKIKQLTQLVEALT